MDLRAATPHDTPAIERIYREVGWIDDDEAQQLVPWLADADLRVACLDGVAEGIGTRHAATMCVDGTDLPLTAVTSIAVSRVARRRGFAGALTARTVVDGAEEGAALAALGMFDQGFYDRLGFGTGASQVIHQVDPSTLRVDPPSRAPVRLGPDDWEEVHAATVARQRAHGGVVVTAGGFTRGELGWAKPLFALGFRDDHGDLVDLAWGEAKGEHGPWRVDGLVYRDTAGLLDLLGLLAGLADQVHHLEVVEPPELSMQDLLTSPFRHRRATERAEHPARARAASWWQARVLDLEAVVAARSWDGPPVRLVVEVDDPLTRRDDVTWEGVHGPWTIELAATSSATRGATANLPVVQAGVGALTRILLGVAPATRIAVTDALAGPADLLARLDRALATSLPPTPGMWF